MRPHGVLLCAWSAVALTTAALPAQRARRVAALPAASARAAMTSAPVVPPVLCAIDVATGAPVDDPRLEAPTATGWQRVATVTRDPRVASCVRVAHAVQGARVRRLGYTPSAPVAFDDVADDDTLWVRLTPIAALLPAAEALGDARGGGRNAVSLAVQAARAHGAASTGALVALLPFAQPRSARGEVTVSLRGTRREQVAVTLDGLPLTDPATGVADVGDLPLGILGGATVVPGSDPLGVGPGAIGGVLALHGGRGTQVTSRIGAFGAAQVELTHDRAVGANRLRVGLRHEQAINDFPFDNTVSTTGVSLRERRVNNDTRRLALFAQWRGERVQVVALGTDGEQGLVGPVNVRDADEDRARTRRAMVRVAGDWGRTQLTVGARAFTLAYRDPLRPIFDTDADAQAVDVEAQRVHGPVRWQAGVGADRLRATNGVAQDRARAHAALTYRASLRGLEVTSGIRLDVIERSGAQPTASLAVERAWARTLVGARVAQAVRVPTLYDLYFSSPQRLTVRALRPERVTLDGELYARRTVGAWGGGTLATQGALVTRTARDAIIWLPGNFGWSPANVGRESLRGVEARVEWTHRHAHVSAWGTWYDAQLVSGSLRIPTPYVARASGGLMARRALGPVTLASATRVVGRRPYTSGPRDPAFELPAVGLLDLAASVAHARPARATLGGVLLFTLALDNVTNEAWQSVRGFPAAGRSWSMAVTWTP